MLSHFCQAVIAVAVWAVTLVYAGVPQLLAVLLPADVALVALAVIRWRSLST